MSNSSKRQGYERFVKALDALSRSDSVQGLESTTDKACMIFRGGFHPQEYPEGDYAAETVRNVERYCELLDHRKKKVIAGGERVITTEDEALESFKLAYGLLSNFVCPNFERRSEISNTLLNDLYNLSLAYASCIVNGVADEYIPKEQALEEKLKSVAIAKQAKRIEDSRRMRPFLKELLPGLRLLGTKLDWASPDLMRPFATVPVTQKKVYKKNKLMERLRHNLVGEGTDEPTYSPQIVFPIAHGGIELGVLLDNAYEDAGHGVTTYPLMFSIKTRRQKYPWVMHDADFLDEGLEGKKVLITEDWITTGNTLRGIIQELEKGFPAEIRVATIKRDPEKSNVPLLDKYEIYEGQKARYLGEKTDAISDMNKP